jgi:magnesium-transporting ATPase (P-type)
MAARSATRTTRAGQAPADWQALPAQATLDRLEASVAGLTSVEAALRLRRAGPNLLPTTAPPGALQVGLRQLKSPLIYVLLAAALASLW